MKTYIACNIAQDGMGARVQRIFNVCAFAYYLNEEYSKDIEYLNVPLSYEGFGVNFLAGEKTRSKNYSTWNREGYIKSANEWDKTLNYVGVDVNNIILNDFTIVKGDMTQVVREIKNNEHKNKIYLISTLHKHLDRKDLSIEIMKKYRSKIFSLFQFKHEMSNEIIIHIRRSDIVKYQNRILNDDYYLNILDTLTKNGNENIIITTQRLNFNPKPYNKYKIIYDDEISSNEMFIRMINAKLLVLSISSFSYASALLCNGIVVYPKMRHIKMNDWILKNEIKNIKNGKI